ncbi:disease resistance protein RGA2-like [Triticum dicoccoides]|uniref:disease resistance protein RGA2-like n=1 Tax=Triticum dicoccoides TaxID=85692 RepID=UPI00189070DD|nr:disease resistance protein RGA2-like [Triticum dicoccoides]
MAQAIVQRICVKLRSAIEDEAMVRLNVSACLREILEALETMEPLLEKAEILLFRSKVELELLRQVRVATYQIMDIVDELQDARSQATAMMTRMLPHIPTTKNTMAMKLVLMKTKIMNIKDRYSRYSRYSLFKESEDAEFQKIIDGRKTWPNRPFLEEALVFERGSNKQRIVDVLLFAEHITREPITTILPIFGLAGIGKTTLAQMMFNDTHFLPGYDFRVWVQVWPELDFHTVGESIIHRITGATGEQEINDDHGSQKGIESIMDHLHQVLNGKKVLLILDDLWEEDAIQLQLLKSMLTFFGDKVDVIVTTCNQAIARNICTVESYKLKPLSDDTCWEIIKKSFHLKKRR